MRRSFTREVHSDVCRLRRGKAKTSQSRSTTTARGTTISDAENATDVVTVKGAKVLTTSMGQPGSASGVNKRQLARSVVKRGRVEFSESHSSVHRVRNAIRRCETCRMCTHCGNSCRAEDVDGVSRYASDANQRREPYTLPVRVRKVLKRRHSTRIF